MRWFWSPLTMAALGLALELGPGPTGSKQNPPSKGRAAFPTCEAAAQSCTTHFPDRTSYPNIASGFRGFDIVLGGVSVPENSAGKKGYIFDEAKERSGEVRFNNIAGEEFAQCTSDLEVHIIKSVEELFNSEHSTDISSSSLQVGPEIDLNVDLNGVGSLSNTIMNLIGSAFSSSAEQGSTQEEHQDSHANAHANAHAEACAGGSAEVGNPLFGKVEGHFEGCIGGDIGGDIGTTSGTSSGQTSGQAQAAQASNQDINQSGTSFSLGAKVSAGFTIPPVLKSLASNNKRTQKIATSIDSKEVITSIASTHCKRYAYQLQSYSPPFFHSAFKSGLVALNQCWNASAHATPNSFQCARNFIESYGTHFIKRATFGAKVTTTRVMDYGKANKVSRQSLDKCTRSQSTWSALAVFTAGDKSSECQNNLSTGFSIDQSGLQTEHTESVGCKPSVDYGEDGPFPPEIIEKTLAPLSDLFTSDYMTEERVGEAIDYKGIGPWLYNKILDYCVLFKSEHHCKHTTRLPYSAAHCPGVNRKRSKGFYTGGLDQDFLPHTPDQHGVLTISSDPPEQIKALWVHGCPSVECEVDEWTRWSPCSASSGRGMQERRRRVLREPQAIGAPCPDLVQTKWCQPGLIITGGTNFETGNLKTVESYPLTCTIPEMPTARYGHTTSVLPTSPPTLVVCGGQGEGDGWFTSDPAPYNCIAWRNDMVEWKEHLGASLGVPRVQHSAWVPADQNTKIVLFGGVSGQAMNTAEVVGGDQSFELQNDASYSCSISLPASVILTGGSLIAKARQDSDYVHAAVDRYDTSGFVEAMPSLRTARHGHGCGFIRGPDGTTVLVVAGGNGGYTVGDLDTAEILRSTGYGGWAPGWTPGPRLPKAILLPRAAPLQDKLLLTGGWDTQYTHFDSVMELDYEGLEKHYWTQVGSMQEPRSAHSIVSGNLTSICG